MRRVFSPQTEPPEWVMYDGYVPCPYLPEQTARMPMRLPARALTREETARRLEMGDRRQGVFLYRPTCPACRACEALRLPVAEFRASRTQRRVFRRGEELIETQIAAPEVDPERVRLFNRHKLERDLLIGDELLDHEGYERFLVESCVESIELRYRVGGRLIGVAVSDVAADSLSAVYCYFDPDFERLSPGTFSILKQVDLCARWGLRYLYLGLYVGACASVAYKANYFPHERLIGGRWERFEKR